MREKCDKVSTVLTVMLTMSINCKLVGTPSKYNSLWIVRSLSCQLVKTVFYGLLRLTWYYFVIREPLLSINFDFEVLVVIINKLKYRWWILLYEKLFRKTEGKLPVFWLTRDNNRRVFRYTSSTLNFEYKTVIIGGSMLLSNASSQLLEINFH